MVVVAIIGIIVAAAVPSLYGVFHKSGFSKTMNDMVEASKLPAEQQLDAFDQADKKWEREDTTVASIRARGAGAGPITRKAGRSIRQRSPRFRRCWERAIGGATC